MKPMHSIANALVAALALGAVSEGDPVARARAFYRSQPRYLRPVTGDRSMPGLLDLRAESCGACHAAIYAEWRLSTHARAWLDDAQFQEELKKHDGHGGPHAKDARWICVNCHTPYETQLERLVVGLEDGDLGRPRYVANPDFDAKFQREAISCATCHVRDGVIVGPYGDTLAPHPVAKGEHLLTSSVCLDCHQAVANLDEVALACVFDTGFEHAATDAAKQGETCQSCHMPEIVRPAANIPPRPPRKGRHHFFGGSLIPKKPEFAADMAAMRRVHEDGMTAEWVELPETIAPGAKTVLRFAAINSKTGHMLPSGDPERFILVTATVKDAGGIVLARREEYIGSKYQWEPVKKLSDTRLAPGERRVFDLEFTAPAGGTLALEIAASKHRMNQANFDYHQLAGRYVAGIDFLSVRAERTVSGE